MIAASTAASIRSASEETLDRIRAVVGPKGWLQDAEAVEPFMREQRGLFHGQAAMVVRPATTEEVSRVVAICHETGTPIVPQGGNTGLVGGSVSEPGSILLSLSRMNAVRKVDAESYSMTVEAGCILAELQRVAAEHDRLFPLSLGAEGSCQIGGNLSTNAGGMNVLRYGNARDLVLGLEVVLPDGQVIEGLRGLRKDNTGYDLKNLFIGAEGTLGIVTAAVLKLFPMPRDTAVAFVAVADPQAAVSLLASAKGFSGDSVTTFELMSRTTLQMVLDHAPGSVDPIEGTHDWYVLMELTSPRQGAGLGEAMEECLADAFERGWALDAAIAQNEAQTKAFRRLREDASDAQKYEGGSIKHDVSIPVALVPEFLARADAAVRAALPDIRPVAFGHVGDGNIHYNLSQPKGADKDGFLARWYEFNRIVHDVVYALEGSFSAEHGIGRLKVEELRQYKSPAELALMTKIKDALDPTGIMNPGKVIAR